MACANGSLLLQCFNGIGNQNFDLFFQRFHLFYSVFGHFK